MKLLKVVIFVLLIICFINGQDIINNIGKEGEFSIIVAEKDTAMIVNDKLTKLFGNLKLDLIPTDKNQNKFVVWDSLDNTIKLSNYCVGHIFDEQDYTGINVEDTGGDKASSGTCLGLYYTRYNFMPGKPVSNAASNRVPGIYWDDTGNRYEFGIYRPSGTWEAPDYLQMKIAFETGIIMEPGTGDDTGFGRSFVEITNGKGLRVTQGSVGIGTTDPTEKLSVVGTIESTTGGFKFPDGTVQTTAASGSGSGDDWGTQVVQTNATLAGDGTTGNELMIAQQGATNGQVLKWDGSDWLPGDDEIASGGGDNWGSQVVVSDATLDGDGTSADPLTVVGGGSSDGDAWGVTGEDQSSAIGRTGNVGIGTSSPTTKLEVVGQIKVTGGTPGAGKVLTSDADGLATWETPTSSSGESFWANSETTPPYNSDDIFKYLGNVGIGSIYPSSRLHILEDGYFFPENGALVLEAGTNQTVDLTFSNDEAQDPITKGESNYNKSSTTKHSWKLSLRDDSDNQEFQFLYQYGSGNPWNEKLSLLTDGELQVKKIRFPDGSLQTTASSGSGGDSPWYTDGGGIRYDGKVGINNSNSGFDLLVDGSMRLTGTFWDYNNSKGTDGQVLKSDGNNGVYWGNVGSDPTTSVETSYPLEGSGATGDPVKIVNGNSAGQVLKWNGSSWVLGEDESGGSGTTLWSNSGDHIYYDSGNVNVGSDSSDGNLNVHGTIFAEEVNVTLDVPFPDFVFKEDYVLKSINEVENFINDNGHLPDIPSESDVLENGLSIGKMQAKLLQKIEELTLYIIELDKKNKQLEILLNNM